MKAIVLLLIISSVVGACTPKKAPQSQKETAMALTPISLSGDAVAEVQTPGKTHIDATLHIQQVQKGLIDGKPALVVRGHFSNGCAYLSAAVLHTEEGLKADLQSKYPDQMMCTQALVPFVYAFLDVDRDLLTSSSSISINGTTYSF